MSRSVQRLVLGAVAAAAAFLLLEFVIHPLLGLWWADVVLALAIAFLVWKAVSEEELARFLGRFRRHRPAPAPPAGPAR